jgi:[acyl-carrier-protein] S-malonyltransferase
MARTAYLFPGQGAQYVGMGKALADALPSARKLYDEAGDVLGYDLLQVGAEGPAERLNSTEVSQPAIYVASLAALESLRQSEPDAEKECVGAAGLSLGEYTALTFAGAWTFADGLRLVKKRGEAMQAAADRAPGAMVSILGLDQPKVEDLCTAAGGPGAVRLANLLCPGNLVVSGQKAACEKIEQLAEQAGARTLRLTVAGAFHTPMMGPAVEELAQALKDVSIGALRTPVWANVSARPYQGAAEIRQLLTRQVVEPVLWEPTVRALLAGGCDRFYEIGPGRVLVGLLKRVARKVDCRNIAA